MTDTSAKPALSMVANRVRVWDPLVRVVHWSLVIGFVIAWLSAEDFSTLHEIAGYVIAGLLALRLIWGLVGGRYARFAGFVKGPQDTLAYLRDMARGRERRYLGHNPAGAAMIVALLLALSGTAFTGWLIAEPDRVALLPDLPQIVAPAWADGDREEGDEGGFEIVEDLHEVLANLLIVLVALHVGGVVLTSARHHENLARAMITGDKRAPSGRDVV